MCLETIAEMWVWNRVILGLEKCKVSPGRSDSKQPEFINTVIAGVYWRDLANISFWTTKMSGTCHNFVNQLYSNKNWYKNNKSK